MQSPAVAAMSYRKDRFPSDCLTCHGVKQLLTLRSELLCCGAKEIRGHEWFKEPENEISARQLEPHTRQSHLRF